MINNITFNELDLQRDSTATVRQIEILLDGKETGMILETRTLRGNGVKAFLWIKLKNMVVEVRPHMIFNEENKDLGNVKDYVRENFKKLIDYCKAEILTFGSEVETAEVRITDIIKMIDQGD